MAELGVGVGCEFFSELDHIFNCLVRSISCGVVNIDSFKFDVEGGHIESVKADDIPSYFVNFRNIFLFFLGA